MFQLSLYQKVSVVSFIFFLGACIPGPIRVRQSPVPFPILKTQTLPPHISMSLSDEGTHLLITGVESSGQSLSLLWDTGSDLSFYESPSAEESKEFRLVGKRFTLKNKKGVLPESIPGLLGLDFFRGSCIFWMGTELKQFPETSPFCEHPEAYLSLDFKFLNTKKKGEHFYVQFEYPEGHVSYGLVDTGSSLNLLPGDTRDRFLGEKKVFLAGNKIQRADLMESTSTLYLFSKTGIREEYRNVQFLTGISLENFLLPGDKDREEVWVIGLDILRTRPLFWDFSRGRLGIVHSKN
ncbi:hypothetical protein ND861_07910 [Leptospira sp. 2 VSF19]|uniref:Aspartyl protease n=1 Tax=Leptospira soteropolitanensis TaxID=2950025 RepID=A0AAW5VHW4_9LEPT|nr:hypothetical protein [Leptospira soteropolitanensis]MCW7492919.1 hypothetical protein [Leptospira soteropolitanensis]MCW7500154.1 hypothetical protein [Leptospira soteropolitanensis]MCW7522405.1 hypothetical protein [Leptospira soteropolitanensis]MCW7526261.1 hypothetical protein [Leptospira soteropolitanensis]MCW7529627.1 hypothetical protein [Leptospira soteropolitanensis]